MQRSAIAWATGNHPHDAEPQYITEFDPATATVWGWLRPHGVPCFNLGVLNEIRAFDAALEENAGCVPIGDAMCPVEYYVVASKSRGVFSWGGDLRCFLSLIQTRDREGLARYMRACIENVHGRLRNYGSQSLTTVSLVQGAALGGGLECALSSDVLIAEENVSLGLPEVLFNLFPGMGAYNLLARRIGIRAAESLLLSGETYSATELHALGVVDCIAKSVTGEEAVAQWIVANRKRQNATRAVYRSRQFVSPISRSELMGIGELWVEAALRLQCRDLKVMERLANRQSAATRVPEQKR